MTYPPYGPPPQSAPFPPVPPTGNQPKKRKGLTIALSAVVAALLVAVTAIATLVLTSGDDLPGVTLRSANEVGDDPFVTGSLRNAEIPTDVRLAVDGTALQDGVRVVNGTDPGIYTRASGMPCDTAALGNSLAANPGAAQAWASVFGISTASIPAYLNSLTPVVLTADTWVTNHSYTSGVARAFQSVLQSGTAVYVDAAGVPRVQCACGNPLAPPAASPLRGYRTVGSTWNDYSTTRVVRVAYYNEHVTTVNNTTTVVQAPSTPAVEPAERTLQIINAVTRAIEAVPVTGGLDPATVPAADEPLPNPFSPEANRAFVPADPEQAAENGVTEDGAPLDEVVEAAEDESHVSAQEDAARGGEGSESAGAPADESETATDPQADTGDAGADSEEPSESTTDAAPESREPTVFTGSTGGATEVIGSFTFDDDGDSVTCRIDPTTSEVDCSDNATVVVSPSALTPTSVRSATDSDGVWTLSLTRDGSTERLEIDSATWTTPPAPTSSATPEQAPAPAPEVTPESTPEVAPQTPAAEPETTTAVPEPPVTEEAPADPAS